MPISRGPEGVSSESEIQSSLEAKKAQLARMLQQEQLGEFGTDASIAEGEQLTKEIAGLEKLLGKPSGTVH